jgi:hypothetical protein
MNLNLNATVAYGRSQRPSLPTVEVNAQGSVQVQVHVEVKVDGMI